MSFEFDDSGMQRLFRDAKRAVGSKIAIKAARAGLNAASSPAKKIMRREIKARDLVDTERLVKGIVSQVSISTAKGRQARASYVGRADVKATGGDRFSLRIGPSRKKKAFESNEGRGFSDKPASRYFHIVDPDRDILRTATRQAGSEPFRRFQRKFGQVIGKELSRTFTSEGVS